MIKKQTVTIISFLLVLLIIFVNVDTEKKAEIVEENITVEETVEKEPFKIENLGNIIYPKHPLVGWFVVGLVIAGLVAVMDRVRIKSFFKKRRK